MECGLAPEQRQKLLSTFPSFPEHVCDLAQKPLCICDTQHNSANMLQTSHLGYDAMHLRNAQVCSVSRGHLDILPLLPVRSHCQNNTQTLDANYHCN